MLIVNPIYDIVFKYLMEDTEIARQLIEKILDTEIIELEPKPQEIAAKLPTFALNVYRFDFRAIIKTKDKKGNEVQKKVLIELQKAKKETDLLRFRKYLGENYATHDEETVNKRGRIVAKNYPIITIYFLGFNLANIKTTVLRIDRGYYDVTNKKMLKVTHKFVELLTHTAYIIQIPRLQEPLKSDLEKILNVFNQKYVLSTNKYILNFPIETSQFLNPLFQKILSRLGNATADEKFLKEIELVESVENELLEWIRKSKENEVKLQESEDKNQVLVEENQRLVEERLKAEEERLKAEEERLKAEEERLKAEEEKLKAEEQRRKAEVELAAKEALIQELLGKLKIE